MAEQLYPIKNTFFRLDRRLPLTVHQPVEPTARSHIAVLAMHSGNYILNFEPVVELARRGFIAAGAFSTHLDPAEWILDHQVAAEFMRQYPGVKKLILMGHSQGGCRMSCYQYITENGTMRFKNTDRAIPFPDIPPLAPADGLMLVDANYGIMSMLAMDPAVKSLANGFDRIPELDIYNPANGYAPEGSHYLPEFIRKFQKAQAKSYMDLVAMAKERLRAIQAGKGSYSDNEPIVIPGAKGGSSNNKLFIQDVSLLSRTRMPHPVLHADGTVTTEIAHTVRRPEDAVRADLYKGALSTTVRDILLTEMRFDDDFGYDESSMWGSDWDFNYLSSRANVKGISVPLLVSGNTGSHEFVQTEYNYENAKSGDKSIVFIEGADHGFKPLKSAEAYPGQFGDTVSNAADYFAQWLAKPGRF